MWNESTSLQPLLAEQRDDLALLESQLRRGAPEDDLERTLAHLDLVQTAARVTEDDFWEKTATILTPRQRAGMVLELWYRAGPAWRSHP